MDICEDYLLRPKRRKMFIINSHRGGGMPANGLMAYYPFSGNANDESVNNNHGTVNGATLTTDRNSNANAAYSFDGNDYVTIGNFLDFAGTNDLAISVWFYYSADGQIIGRDNAVSRQWACYISGGRFSLFAIDSGAFNVAAQSAILLTNTWYHGVAQFESGVPKIYINTVNNNPVQSGTLLSFNTAAINNDIGRRPNGTFFYTGKLDAIRVYNRALEPAEITQLYNE